MPKPNPTGWLITFSDMIALLLTFFVLLLSMSSMDRKTIQKGLHIFWGDVGYISDVSAGQIPTRYEFVGELLQRPWEFRDHEQRVRDLLFPDEVLPKEIERSTIDESIKFLKRPEGLAILFTDDLLFPLGEFTLTDPARTILAQLVPLMQVAPNDINISGHTDNLPGRIMDNYTLSALRGMAVLECLLDLGVPEARLSVSGYGEQRPVADNTSPEGRALNRRVEILFKTGL